MANGQLTSCAIASLRRSLARRAISCLRSNSWDTPARRPRRATCYSDRIACEQPLPQRWPDALGDAPVTVGVTAGTSYLRRLSRPVDDMCWTAEEYELRCSEHGPTPLLPATMKCMPRHAPVGLGSTNSRHGNTLDISSRAQGDLSQPQTQQHRRHYPPAPATSSIQLCLRPSLS